ncbi:hypothetical protein M23134_05180 [Microscilla marina ATCC 23134]|uniref:Uncharacterized protein n=1 Tax=Microscilla marina ATCC 23134 TaxID=313606 RepID=A1ZDD5_MICM2|nr:hypothetical protein M23134_05180 [Microscilla marina ATCC 23134]
MAIPSKNALFHSKFQPKFCVLYFLIPPLVIKKKRLFEKASLLKTTSFDKIILRSFD